MKGWEDYYEVNTDGEVRNKKNNGYQRHNIKEIYYI
ncbi:hypothetical protein [Clostridium sp.]